MSFMIRNLCKFNGISRNVLIECINSNNIISHNSSSIISSPFLIFGSQVSHFSKYISKSRTKRLPLTTKRAGKGFYKGNGARKEGYINSRAKFIQVQEMLTDLQVPDLTGFKLMPYVGAGAKRNVHETKVKIVV